VPSKAAFPQAAFPEPSTASAWAQVVPSQLLFQQFVAVHNPRAAFDMHFRREAFTPLAHRLESTVVR
jgi:hypothetical protein